MIDAALEILGYRFKRPALLEEALTHASSANTRVDSNERMEFLGDAVLGFVVCEYLFDTYPDLLEGDLTKIKSTVVSRRTCAKISKAIGLSDMLSLGKGMAGRPGLPNSVAAAAFESIIAAIYMDGGLEPVKAFILEHIKPYVEEAEQSAHQHNFKSVLQQFSQKYLPTHPQYVMIGQKGPDHAKAFEVGVQLFDRKFSPAWANSKKEAEQKAALLALTELGLLRIDDDGQVHIEDEAHEEAIARELLERARPRD